MSDTKIFNMEDAQAGAPYACVDGLKAEIIKWDCMGAVPLAGIITNDLQVYPALWNADGTASSDTAVGLVMLPLGYIDGKPVFVGDEYVVTGSGKYAARPGDRNFEDCHWPEPEKQYPITTMSSTDLYEAYANAYGHGVESAMVAVADAAIRHAIDSGQLCASTDRAARDMAIAQSVKRACAEGDINNIDLSAIIASVMV